MRLSEMSAGGMRIPEGHFWARLPIAGTVLGLAALGLTALLGWADRGELLRSYLVAYLFWLSLALGALFFVLVQLVSRAGWSVAVRRIAEHLMGTLPLLALLFIPIALGVGDLYEWSAGGAGDALAEHKALLLNPGFFRLRSAVYLLVWALTAWWLRSRSLSQDESADPALAARLRSTAAPALVLFFVTGNLAAFDWIMSLDAHWYSTIFGVYFLSGAAMGGIAALVAMVVALERGGLMTGAVDARSLHDLGKLLFGLMVFWAYIAFSQYLLIWYANLPEETAYFALRLAPGWLPVTRLLAVGHFVLPFFLLLPRWVKRRRDTLLAAALWLLAMHYLDLYWLVMPGLRQHGLPPHLLDVGALLGLGGLFLGTLARLLGTHPLVPLGDPRLAESPSGTKGPLPSGVTRSDPWAR